MSQEVVHIEYETSSPSPSIPKMLDKLANALIAFTGDAGEILKEMLEADPNCFIAQALASAFNLSRNVSDGREDLKLCEEAAAKVGGRGKLTKWECQWLDAVELMSKLQLREAVHLMMDMLSDNPFDVITIFISHYLCLFLVDKFLMRDALSRVMPAYPKNHRYRAAIEALYGFSMLETFHLAKAEKLIGDAMAGGPENCYTIHSHAHLLEHLGKYEEGINYLDKTQSWFRDTGFRGHLYWHLASFRLGLGQKEEAYELFQDVLKTTIGPNNSTFPDTTALLWQLKTQGYPVTCQDFQSLIKGIGDKIAINKGPFYAFHANACYLGAEDESGLAEYQRSLDAFLSSHPDTEIVRKFHTVGKPLMQSMQCFAQGDYPTAARIAYDVRDRFLDLGGSEAQKDFIHYMLFHSLKNSNFPEPQLKLKSLLWERSGYRELAPHYHVFRDNEIIS